MQPITREQIESEVRRLETVIEALRTLSYHYYGEVPARPLLPGLLEPLSEAAKPKPARPKKSVAEEQREKPTLPVFRGESGKFARQIRGLAPESIFTVKEVLAGCGVTDPDEMKTKWATLSLILKALRDSGEVEVHRLAAGPNPAVYRRTERRSE